MAFNFNLTSPEIKKAAEDAEKGIYTLIPEGSYLVRCESVDFAFIGKDSKPAWKLIMTVVPGEPQERAQIRDTLWWSDKGLGRVLMCLSAFGVPDSKLTNIDPDTVIARNLITGKTVIVDVEHSKPDAKGKIYANVTYAGYHSALPGALEEMRAKRASGGGAAGGSDAAGGAAGTVDYGNIPF